MHSKIKTLIAIGVISFICVQVSADETTYDKKRYEAEAKKAEQLYKKAEEQSTQIVLDLPQNENAMATAAAHDVVNQFKSKDFQNRVNSEKLRLQNKFFNEGVPGVEKPVEQGAEPEKENTSKVMLASDERIYIFVSSSIPKDILKTYVRDVAKLSEVNDNVTVVFRGFINGMKKVKPTLEYMHNLLKVEDSCQDTISEPCDIYATNIDIDPLVFRKFGITKVPAVLYLSGVSPIDMERSIGDDNNQNGPEIKKEIFYGDMGLQYALTMLSEQAHKPHLAQIASTLGKGYYNESAK